MSKPYSDIPGTIVFDSDQAAIGYHLNQFCITLRLAHNRTNRSTTQKHKTNKVKVNITISINVNIVIIAIRSGT